MADRELPQLPPTQDAEENDHDYDILDDQKLAYHAALTPPSVTRMVDYDTIENLQMGLAQSQYCTSTRGGCLGCLSLSCHFQPYFRTISYLSHVSSTPSGCTFSLALPISIKHFKCSPHITLLSVQNSL